MLINEVSIYEVTGGDYSVYCQGYTQARTVTNDIMKRDPWGGIPFVIRKNFEYTLDDKGNVVMTKHVYRIDAATEDEALLMLKTEFHDSDYDIIDEKLKSIKLEKGEE